MRIRAGITDRPLQARPPGICRLATKFSGKARDRARLGRDVPLRQESRPVEERSILAVGGHDDDPVLLPQLLSDVRDLRGAECELNASLAVAQEYIPTLEHLAQDRTRAGASETVLADFSSQV